MRKTKSEIINQLQASERALRRNIYDLTKRQEFLIQQMSEISQGLGSKPTWYNEEKHTWVEAIKWKAAKCLEIVSKMPLREGP